MLRNDISSDKSGKLFIKVRLPHSTFRVSQTPPSIMYEFLLKVQPVIKQELGQHVRKCSRECYTVNPKVTEPDIWYTLCSPGAAAQEKCRLKKAINMIQGWRISNARSGLVFIKYKRRTWKICSSLTSYGIPLALESPREQRVRVDVCASVCACVLVNVRILGNLYFERYKYLYI